MAKNTDVIETRKKLTLLDKFNDLRDVNIGEDIIRFLVARNVEAMVDLLKDSIHDLERGEVDVEYYVKELEQIVAEAREEARLASTLYNRGGVKEADDLAGELGELAVILIRRGCGEGRRELVALGWSILDGLGGDVVAFFAELLAAYALSRGKTDVASQLLAKAGRSEKSFTFYCGFAKTAEEFEARGIPIITAQDIRGIRSEP